MNTSRKCRIAGIVLMVLGVWLLASVYLFLTGEKWGAELYRQIEPKILENEVKLNVAELSEPTRGAIVKLNKWILFERSGRIEYAVAGAFFALALTLLLSGFIVIQFGRIRTIEKWIQEGCPTPADDSRSSSSKSSALSERER